MRDLGLTAADMGLVFSAFALPYALGEIPSGWLCDRFGVRTLLTRVVLLWSLFTCATGWAWNIASLVTARLLFGLGESGCFPGIASMFRGAFTPEQRNVAEGIKAASARWGAALTPVLIAALLAVLQWKHVFLFLGGLGVLWAALFSFWARGSIHVHPKTHDHRVRWRRFIESRRAWLLGVQWFCHYYGFYFYITWLPTYLQQVRGINLRKDAWFAAVPLITAGLGSLFGGWMLSQLARYLASTTAARRLQGYIAYGGAAILLLTCMLATNPVWALVTLSLSSFAAELSGPISWTAAMDIGEENTGAVSGFMNMLGHLGGSVAPSVTGFLLVVSHRAWDIAFMGSAAIYAIGGLCWWFIDPESPLELG
jgi:MFS family permease